jgi:hypothetical protein
MKNIMATMKDRYKSLCIIDTENVFFDVSVDTVSRMDLKEETSSIASQYYALVDINELGIIHEIGVISKAAILELAEKLK